MSIIPVASDRTSPRHPSRSTLASSSCALRAFLVYIASRRVDAHPECSSPGAVHEPIEDDVEVHPLAALRHVPNHPPHLVPRETHVGEIVHHLLHAHLHALVLQRRGRRARRRRRAPVRPSRIPGTGASGRPRVLRTPVRRRRRDIRTGPAGIRRRRRAGRRISSPTVRGTRRRRGKGRHAARTRRQRVMRRRGAPSCTAAGTAARAVPEEASTGVPTGVPAEAQARGAPLLLLLLLLRGRRRGRNAERDGGLGRCRGVRLLWLRRRRGLRSGSGHRRGRRRRRGRGRERWRWRWRWRGRGRRRLRGGGSRGGCGLGFRFRGCFARGERVHDHPEIS